MVHVTTVKQDVCGEEERIEAEVGMETGTEAGVTGTETEKTRSGQTPCNYPSV